MTQLPDTSTEAGQREASVMLARLMGLAPQLFSDVCNFYHEDTYDIFVSIYPHGWYHGMTEDEAWKYFPNLYNPANMALAWQVLNWAFNNLPGDTGQSQVFFDFLNAREYWEQEFLWSMPPAAAQRAWLDKILALASEAGMLEAQS